MLNIVNKLFGSGNKKILKSYSKTINKINEFEQTLANLTDTELQEKTSYFKKILQKGADINQILPEAFAVVREASKRTIGL